MSATHVVVLAGSLSATSKADRMARHLVPMFARRGSRTTLFSGVDLEFPFYRQGEVAAAARTYLAALADADAVVLVSPVYHGGPSGLLKNALDYLNELAEDARPYLDGRVVGCVATSGGDQGASSTLDMLRTMTHALRGWPTPLGLALSGDRTSVDHPRTSADLDVLVEQVLMRHRVVTPISRAIS